MKKYAGALAVMLMLPGAALAEGYTQGVQVDLTGVITSLMMLGVELILAWAAKSLLPSVRAWIAGRADAEQRKLLYELTEKLVAAAEQLLGSGRGREKLEYVVSGLEERGLTADTDLIEAAVREMNRKALQAAEWTLDVQETPKN